MSSLVLLVELTIDPNQMEAFLTRARQHRTNVLKNEPGCRGFELLVPVDSGNTVFLYEVYADQAAIDHHMASLPLVLPLKRKAVSLATLSDPRQLLTPFPSRGEGMEVLKIDPTQFVRTGFCGISLLWGMYGRTAGLTRGQV